MWSTTETFAPNMFRVNRFFSAVFDPRDLLSHLAPFESSLDCVRRLDRLAHRKNGSHSAQSQQSESMARKLNDTSHVLKFVMGTAESFQSKHLLSKGTMFFSSCLCFLSPSLTFQCQASTMPTLLTLHAHCLQRHASICFALLMPRFHSTAPLF